MNREKRIGMEKARRDLQAEWDRKFDPEGKERDRVIDLLEQIQQTLLNGPTPPPPLDRNQISAIVDNEMKNTERYYIEKATPHGSLWRVIDSRTGIPVYDNAEYGDDKPALFRTYEEAEECCKTLKSK